LILFKRRLELHLHFRKIARGPAWERWLIAEEQHGDQAFAGEAVLTYSDDSSGAELDCDILFARELTEPEVEDVLSAVCTILSGRGNVTIYSAREVVCRGFSLTDGSEEETES
jgi:Fe-S-cluster containining protein